KSLPVDRPDELVALLTRDTKNTTQFGNLLPLSYPNLTDLREMNITIAQLAAYSPPLPLRMSTGDAPERVFGQLVTGNYFSVLGIEPAAGRFFSDADDRTPDSHPVAVIGYGLWQRRFGGRPDVVGATVGLNRRSFTVVS